MKIDFLDPQIWVAVSFILFFIIFGKLIWKKFTIFLDNRILTIKAEIDEAKKLHSEAKKLLSEETKKMQDLDFIIKEIIDNSKNKSYEILSKNTKKIEDQIQLLEKEAIEKIKVIENQALEEIKMEIISKASLIAEKSLKSKISDVHQNLIMEESVEKTKKIFN